MSVCHSTIFIALSILILIVWCKPQYQNAASLTTIGERRVARSYIGNVTETNGGQPFYGIHVRRSKGVLRTVISNSSTISSRQTINHELENAVTAIPTTTTDCTIMNRCKRDSNFVFPDDENVHPGHTSAMKCESTFCEHTYEYPFAMVEERLRQDRSKFILSFDKDKYFENDVKLTIRIHGDDDNKDEDIQMCRSRRKVIYPRKAEAIDSSWKFIVNQNDTTQGVVIELCDTELNAPCMFSDRFPVGYQAVCKQHYVYRQLVSFSDEGGPFEKNYFKMPSCCKCVLKSV